MYVPEPEADRDRDEPAAVSRQTLMMSTTTTTAAAPLAAGMPAATTHRAPRQRGLEPRATPADAGSMLSATFRFNGTEHRLNLD